VSGTVKPGKRKNTKIKETTPEKMDSTIPLNLGREKKAKSSNLTRILKEMAENRISKRSKDKCFKGTLARNAEDLCPF